MIESIEFTNFKALRKTTLPLSPFTLLLGPNGSGKTTVLQALQRIAELAVQDNAAGGTLSTQQGVWSSLLNVTAEDRKAEVEIKLRIRLDDQVFVIVFKWKSNGQVAAEYGYENGLALKNPDTARALTWLSNMRTYFLDPTAIASPVQVISGVLSPNGAGLAAVLDDLRDNHSRRWNSLIAEMSRWLPEYETIEFDKPQPGHKAIALRTKKGEHRIPAKDLSQGTMVALALITLAYLPNPPSLVGLEEIDRGLHPRLLRHLQGALYRLSHPESCGETRPPIQVIATTHSPYLLDLYRDHPEEVILAEKAGLEVKMKRLTEIEHYEEILGDAPLSEMWYSGVLGGVSVKP